MNLKSTIRSLLLGAIALTAAPAASAAVDITADVFTKGDEGSKFYRIPAIVTLSEGTLLAVADRRNDSLGDLPGRIDVVARRSTDGGRTWGPQIVVAENDSIGGYGDPAVVVDSRTGHIIIISTHGEGLWRNQPGRISVSRSTDGGLSWLPAVDINPQILTTDLTAPQRIKCNSAFASSGRALQTKDGRILFALVTRINGFNDFPVYAVYSDDGGYTWTVADNPASLNGDEAKIVELADGTLLMSIRTRDRSARQFSISEDHGKTWSRPVGNPTLPDPACNGDVIRYTHGGNDLLIHTLPVPPKFRDDISVYVSTNDGMTWRKTLKIVDGKSAYSSLTVLPDGSLGFLVEEAVPGAGERHEEGYTLRYLHVPFADILPKE